MSEIEQFQAGRQAFWDGKRMDKRRNQHWRRGWRQERDDHIARAKADLEGRLANCSW